MVSQFDSENRRELVHNRWGDEVGVFYLRNGYWEFVKDSYSNELIFTPAEMQYIEKRQAELNT